ncbi:putative HD superfamily hydrolase [Thermoplasmatales archaeon BRNA1]|nr:putative HD superfamily hydrolase [Thermoplasmatales archaeon BRNA1]
MDGGISEKAERFIRGFYEGESTGHDYWHSVRVRNIAMSICDTEPEADRTLVAVAALLHDVDDRKLGGDWKNLPVAEGFLRDNGVSGDEILQVKEIIAKISFKGKDSEVPDSLEGRIVQDADRLDAIGAIGVARVFAYGGKHGRPLFDPSSRPRSGMSEEEYFSKTPDSITHFHEKLLLLRDMMNTAEGRRLAEHRHEFMLEYLAEFDGEWNGCL